MAVSIVTMNTEPKNTSILKTAAIGGAAGVALRYLKPVSQHEVDTVLFGEFNTLKENNIKTVKKAVLEETEQMISKDRNNTALKLFLERLEATVKYETAKEYNNTAAQKDAVDIAKKVKTTLKNSSDEIKTAYKELVKKAFNKAKASKFLSESNIKQTVKQSRPVSAYLLPGIFLGALCGYIYNVVGTISKDQ